MEPEWAWQVMAGKHSWWNSSLATHWQGLRYVTLHDCMPPLCVCMCVHVCMYVCLLTQLPILSALDHLL